MELDGKLFPVTYVNQSLTTSEKNYPVHKLEFLALKWAVVDKLQDYLYGARFVVKTDNNPLTYLLSTAKLDATGHRWLATLCEFQFSLKYQPGVGNRDTDALEDHMSQMLVRRTESMPPEGMHVVCRGCAEGVGHHYRGASGA